MAVILHRLRASGRSDPGAGKNRLHLLTLIFCLVTAVIIGLGVHLYRAEKEEVLKKAAQTLEAVARTKAEQLAEWRKERLRDARVLAANPYLREHVRHLRKRMEGCPERPHLQNWLMEITRAYGFLTILILDGQGQLLLGPVGEDRIPDSGAKDLIAEVIARPRLLFSDLNCEPEPHPLSLSLLVPLLEDQDGDRVLEGILFLCLDAHRFLFPLLGAVPLPDFQAETVLLERQETQIICMSETALDKGNVRILHLPREREDLSEVKAALGHGAILQARDYRGVPVLAFGQPVAETPWVILVKVGEAEVLATLKSYALLDGGVMAGLILLIGLGLHYFWRQEQLEFLQELANQEKKQKARLNLILSALPEMIFLMDRQGRLLFANQAALEAFGGQEESPDQPPPEYPLRADIRDLLRGWTSAALARNSIQTGDICLRAGGLDRIFDYRVMPMTVNEGDLGAVLATLRDITPRKQTEERLARVNRLYASLTQAGDVILRERQPERLYQEFCRIAVAEGGLIFAWVAIVAPDGSHLEAAAFHGREEGYLKVLDLTLREASEEQCPIWAAVKKEAPVILQDLEALANPLPWHHEALSRGYRSLAVIPLRVAGKVAGTINFYAAQAHYFAPEIMELLCRLAGHLGMALELAAQEQHRRQVEKALALHSERLQALLTLHLMTDEPTEALLDYLLEASQKILESKFAFLGFLDDSGQVLRIHRWSKEAMAECALPEKPFYFHLIGGGLWAEVVRKRQPLILNDYALPHPGKRGLPPGHVPLTRLLVVPVLGGQQVVAVAAVANKESDYTPEDAQAFLSLLNKAWEILRRREIEKALEESEAQYRLLVTTIPAVVARGYLDWSMEVFDEKVEALTGYPMEAFNRRQLLWRDLVVPEDIPLMQDVFRKALKTREPYIREYRIRTKDGRIRWVQERSQILFHPDGTMKCISGVLFDITDRVEAQERLTASLREKEILLKEIHHRVKNNMQIISSLLRLQMDQVKSPEVQQVFQESQNRIRSMALLHELLYQSPDLGTVPLPHYLQQLVGGLFRTFRVDPRRIRLQLKVPEVSLGMDLALTCGLIITELVSNSLKHAFPDQRSGEVRVLLEAPAPGELQITIGDDGVGLPPDLNLEAVPSLGLRLVHLLTAQIHGTLERGSGPGTVFHLRVPIPEHHGKEKDFNRRG